MTSEKRRSGEIGRSVLRMVGSRVHRLRLHLPLGGVSKQSEGFWFGFYKLMQNLVYLSLVRN